jgi:F-type H+-transporting ATPase subunit a
MEISIAAEKLFSIGTFTVTNSFFVAVVLTVVLSGAVFLFLGKLQQVPRGFQNLVETVFETMLDFMETVTGDREEARKAFPLVATIFLFVMFSNWMGLLPGMGTVGLAHGTGAHATVIPFIRSASADLNLTIVLSLIAVFSIQFAGIAALGLRGYASKFFVAPWKKPYGVGTVVGLLEIVSEISKILSFSFRLFGNVFAGEVLLTVMLHLVPYFIPLPFLVMEVFVGFIQALVFSMLTLVFLKMATVPHEAH